MKQASLWAIVAVVATLVHGLPPVGNGVDASLTVNVATYNVHQGFGENGDYGVPAAARVLEGVHIVGLQETAGDRVTNGQVDIPANIAHRLDLHHVAGPAGHVQGYGVALLARWPIHDVSIHDLPSGTPRHALVATVAHPSGPIQVLVTHFGIEDLAEERMAQAQAILALTDTDEDWILLGDWNTRPDAPVYDALAARFSDASPGGHPTYPATAPDRRIDHIWLRGWTPGESRVAGGPEASDHRAVIVDVTRT